MTVRALLYDADGTDRSIDLLAGPLPTLTDRQLLWVDLTGHDRAEIERVGSLLHLHRESVKNLLNPIGRPRLDQYGHYFQVNVIAVEPGPAGRSDDGGDADGVGFRPVALDFFSGPNYVVTVHHEDLQFLHDFDDRVREDSGLGALDSASFLAALLDWHVTSYFRVLEDFEQAVDDLDEEVLLHPNDHEFLEDLVTLRRRVSRLRRQLAPHREVFSALARPDFQALAQSESGPAFRTLQDRFERAMDAAENARELVIGSFDLYMTGTTRKTNAAVQVLTIVTVSLGIVGAVAGVMGTNFTVNFFKSGELGFVLMLLGMLALIALVLVIARRQRWL